jgi:hypothetical protein
MYAFHLALCAHNKLYGDRRRPETTTKEFSEKCEVGGLHIEEKNSNFSAETFTWSKILDGPRKAIDLLSRREFFEQKIEI